MGVRLALNAFTDKHAYYKLDIIARLSKLTKVPEDVVELGRKIAVLSPCSLYFPPQLLTTSI